jgi:hypothetical protein
MKNLILIPIILLSFSSLGQIVKKEATFAECVTVKSNYNTHPVLVLKDSSYSLGLRNNRYTHIYESEFINFKTKQDLIEFYEAIISTNSLSENERLSGSDRYNKGFSISKFVDNAAWVSLYDVNYFHCIVTYKEAKAILSELKSNK